MRRTGKQGLIKRASDILRNNEGASIVLVTIIAVIIVAGVIVLSINSSTLLAFADKQYSKDQAYEAATSLGMTIDTYVSEGGIDLESLAGTEVFTDSTNGIEVSAEVECIAENTYVVRVIADARLSEYVFSATYTGSGTTYLRVS